MQAINIIDHLIELNGYLHNRDGAALLEERSIDFLKADIENKIERGWSPIDIYNYLALSEEVNSELDEDTALEKMDAIFAKYYPKSI